jgi:hypothetical protein
MSAMTVNVVTALNFSWAAAGTTVSMAANAAPIIPVSTDRFTPSSMMSPFANRT